MAAIVVGSGGFYWLGHMNRVATIGTRGGLAWTAKATVIV